MSDSKNRMRKSWLSGSLYGVASWLVPVALSLVVTPYIVKGLGAEQYGLYALVLGFIGYSFNLNISRAVTRRVAEARALGDESAIPAMIATGFVLASVAGLLAIAVIWQLSSFYIDSVLGLASSESAHELFLGMMLGALTIFGLLLGQVFTAVIQGYERLDVFGWISGVTSASTIFASLVLVKTGYGFVSLLAATSAITLGMTLVSAIAALHLMGPRTNFRFDRTSANAILSHSKYVIGYQVLSNLVLLFERTVITTNLGADDLSYYVVPMMIGIQFVGFVNGLSLFVFPAVSGRGKDDGSVKEIYSAVSATVFVLSGLALIAAWLHAGTFLTLWMGPEFSGKAAESFRLQMVGLLIVSMATVIFQVAEGLGRPKLNLVATASISAVTVLLMVIPLMGQTIESYAAARAIGFALWVPLIPIFERIVFGSVQVGMWSKIIRSCGPALILFALIQVLAPMLLGEGTGGMLAALALGSATTVCILFLTGFIQDLQLLVKSKDHGTSEAGS